MTEQGRTGQNKIASVREREIILFILKNKMGIFVLKNKMIILSCGLVRNKNSCFCPVPCCLFCPVP
jgi:hypothetical protein